MDGLAQQQRIARSATVVSVGNILSRVMGLARESAIAAVFGASGAVSAYKAAYQVPLTLYEMLVGGMVSSALVPTFSEYAARERRDDLWHMASLLFTLAALGLGLAVLLLEAGAPLLTRALVDFAPPLQWETTRLLRITLLGVFFLGLSGLATALCHALQRFALPAFTTVVFNGSIVVFALLLGPRWRDVRVLAMGLVVGTALQVVLQLPALRGMRYRLTLDWSHPVLRQVVALYLPVILSLVVASLGVLIDRNLASRTGVSSISWMSYATTLREFPLGLVSIAISTAILPNLAAQAAQEGRRPGKVDDPRSTFCATLAGGLGLVLVLTLPAAVGLFVLARPLVALLFQHGEFAEADTMQTALALRYYLVGMVFAAVDLPLVFAFYARKDTLRPALVGVLGVVVYLLVALPTYRALGMVGLILANDAQLAGHALAMIGLFRWRIGTLSGYGVGQTLCKALIAAIAMGGAVCGTMRAVQSLVANEGTVQWGTTVVFGGGVGLGIYVGLCAAMGVQELRLAQAILRQVVRRGGTARQG